MTPKPSSFSILFFLPLLAVYSSRAQPELDLKRKVQELQRQVTILQQELSELQNVLRVKDSGDLVLTNTAMNPATPALNNLQNRRPPLTIVSRGKLALTSEDVMQIQAKKSLDIAAQSGSVNIGTSQNESFGIDLDQQTGRHYRIRSHDNYSVEAGQALHMKSFGAMILSTDSDLGLTAAGKLSISSNAATLVCATTQQETYGLDLEQQVGRHLNIWNGGNLLIETGGQQTLTAQKTVQIESKTSIILKCGDAKIILSRNGDIELYGNVKAKRDSDTIIKGNKISEN